MNARRDELIRLAAETLGCVGQTAYGHWIYRDEPTGLWVVSDKGMHRLGQMLTEHVPDAYAVWCGWVSATEVDVGLIVRDRDITSETDLDLAQECAEGEYEIGTSGDAMDRRDFKPERALLACLLLKFYRDDVTDTVRINDEIEFDEEVARLTAETDSEAAP
jgi:hypothetical protein